MFTEQRAHEICAAIHAAELAKTTQVWGRDDSALVIYADGNGTHKIQSEEECRRLFVRSANHPSLKRR